MKAIHNIALGEYSLESELSDAIALAYNARKNGYKAGDAVSEFARQGKLFETEEDATAADYTNATVLMLADVMNDSRVTRLKKVLSIYNQQAEQSAAGQTDLFAEGVKTKQEILDEVLLLLQHGTESEQQQSLDAAREQRKAAAEQGTGVQENGDTGEGGEGERGNEQSAGADVGGRQTDLGGSQPRQSGGENTEEVDENGRPFVKAADGSTVFGEIRESSGLQPAPIKLSEGYQDQDGKGYGLVHIEANHGEQIRNEGFETVEDFVSYVAQNYDEDNIRVGKRRENGNTTFLIQVTDEHDNTLFIELSQDGSYWNVNSAGVFRKGYSNKKETVAKTEPQQPNNTVSTDSSLSESEESGIAPSEPNGESTVSDGKNTENSETESEKQEKISESCFKEQRYKIFESNSQHQRDKYPGHTRCFKEQRYKIFESNSQQVVLTCLFGKGCFKEQRNKIFESNSQQRLLAGLIRRVVSKSKDTRFLKAIHNTLSVTYLYEQVVSKSKDTRFLKAIHNIMIL